MEYVVLVSFRCYAQLGLYRSFLFKFQFLFVVTIKKNLFYFYITAVLVSFRCYFTQIKKKKEVNFCFSFFSLLPLQPILYHCLNFRFSFFSLLPKEEYELPPSKWVLVSFRCYKKFEEDIRQLNMFQFLFVVTKAQNIVIN